MSEPTVFEICFPSHISRAPVCRPGQTIAGAVVLRLTTPLLATHLQLRFYGIERVRRTPVSVRTEVTEKKQQATTMGQKMVMDKEFFHRELVLWGERKTDNPRLIPSNTLHRFHFSFTMPNVNMPTPRQTPDIEISYSLEATLATAVFDQQKGEKVLRDVHKTAAKCFHFEPVIQHRISHGLAASAPLESIISLKDAALVNASVASGAALSPASSANNAHLLALQASGKTHMNLHVFHATPAYLPGETVELLILAPASKKITAASFQLRENVRCRKSSAPIIDESDVPTLWKYSVDLGLPQEFMFSKLSKNSISHDIGLLGRYLFTSHVSLPVNLNAAEMSPIKPTAGLHMPVPPSSARSISDTSTMSVRSQSTSGAPRIKGDEGLAISNIPGDSHQRAAIPLSPLAESQEVTPGCAANSSSETLETTGSGGGSRANSITGLLHSGGMSSKTPSSSSSVASAGGLGSGIPMRSRTGSLGRIHTQNLFSPSSSAAPQFQTNSASVLTPPSSAAGITGNHRMSKSMVTPDLDDSNSDRSSISETLSIHYHPTAKPTLSSNLVSLARGSQSGYPPTGLSPASGSNAPILAPTKLGRLSITPVPLGGLLAKGSYRFAKISFTLPPIGEMSPVSSAFLDYEYTLDVSMTIGGSFGSTKKTAGRLPLKIVTVRTAAKCDSAEIPSGSVLGDSVFPDPADSGKSLRDSLSVLNLSIGQSDDKPSSIHGSHSHAAQHNGSPANTLTEFHFEASKGAARLDDTHMVDDGSYPSLLTFLQNGDRIPMPELEAINIGSNLM
ncbi:hypothetical protein GGI15_002317 [Coemansia interrupta]|uniref:Arrestin-like N-terminal domain-containing protein n=1 Tax=Coemansia interrupta TaxID=1126814 RepID=A0A9W8LKZ9_9FUNG|nr:hypothetical protein GGI15_002317 [Coemansia interrupta]